jgi:pimeloyl-ACP methyl ester carboxylesterase
VAAYVELDEVRTWYDDHGAGEPLALLHPGGADARAWAPNLGRAGRALPRVRAGAPWARRTPDVEGPITYELMANDTIAFLERIVGRPARLVGCSAARPGPPRERMTLGFRLAVRSICGCVSPDLGWLEGLVLARRTRA